MIFFLNKAQNMYILIIIIIKKIIIIINITTVIVPYFTKPLTFIVLTKNKYIFQNCFDPKKKSHTVWGDMLRVKYDDHFHFWVNFVN